MPSTITACANAAGDPPPGGIACRVEGLGQQLTGLLEVHPPQQRRGGESDHQASSLVEAVRVGAIADPDGEDALTEGDHQQLLVPVRQVVPGDLPDGIPMPTQPGQRPAQPRRSQIHHRRNRPPHQLGGADGHPADYPKHPGQA
nr:hypothetical protein [Micromonospora rhizosphaerae]